MDEWQADIRDEIDRLNQVLSDKSSWVSIFSDYSGAPTHQAAIDSGLDNLRSHVSELQTELNSDSISDYFGEGQIAGAELVVIAAMIIFTISYIWMKWKIRTRKVTEDSELDILGSVVGTVAIGVVFTIIDSMKLKKNTQIPYISQVYR